MDRDGLRPGQALATPSRRLALHPAMRARPFDGLSRERGDVDVGISQWAEALDPGWLEGEFSWYSDAKQRAMRMDKRLLVVHMFNHQTHHRGQVHALIPVPARRYPTPTCGW